MKMNRTKTDPIEQERNHHRSSFGQKFQYDPKKSLLSSKQIEPEMRLNKS